MKCDVIFHIDTKFYRFSFAVLKLMTMENISEKVMMCMITIAAIQFIIIFIIIKSGVKRNSTDYVEFKKNLIELLNSSAAASDTQY